MVKTLSVAAIKDGTVIDHIPTGAAIIILQLLKVLSPNGFAIVEPRELSRGSNSKFPADWGMTKHHRISLGLNLSSTSMGLKDLIKIENRFLTAKEAHDIAVFAPKSTISIIKDYKLVSKIKAKLPLIVERILVCPNERCISRSEPIASLFHVEEHKSQVHLKCHFCEQIFERSEIKDYRP